VDRRIFLLLLLAGAGATGLAMLGLAPSRAIPNLDIHLGQERCKRCGMIISRINYAAAFYIGSQDWQKYDDIGCMVRSYITETNMLSIKVFDINSGEELDASAAYYFLADLRKIRTPMGYNIVATKSYDEAKQMAKEHGSSAIKWNEIPRSGD